MQSLTLVTFLLASFAAAKPAHVEPRGFGGMSASSQQQQQQSSASSAYSHNSAGFANGGFGGGIGLGGINGGGATGGMSSYSAHSSSSSSYSASTVQNSFSTLGQQIGAIQNMMASGSFSQAVASQQITQLQSYISQAISQTTSCGCWGQSGVVSSIYSAFSQLTTLMSSMQSMFGSSFSSMTSSYSSLISSFSSFYQSAQSAGVSMNSIMPPNFPSIMGRAIPGFPNPAGF